MFGDKRKEKDFFSDRQELKTLMTHIPFLKSVLKKVFQFLEKGIKIKNLNICKMLFKRNGSEQRKQ